ncbi:MAG: HEAT repeat domain-containing protein [Myxococcota bacterium]
MSAVLQTWSGLVDGTEEPPSNPHIRKQLLVYARNQASVESEADRLNALKVLRRLGGLDSLSTAVAFVEDPSLDVRQRLLKMATEAASDGVPVLRRMASDPDPMIAVEVIDRLIELKDRAATKRMRTLLQARHPRVRARAAVFLGLMAGPSMAPFLQRHVDDDDDVDSIVQWAIARIDGATEDPPPAPGEPWTGAATRTKAAKPEAPKPPALPGPPPESSAVPSSAPQAAPAPGHAQTPSPPTRRTTKMVPAPKADSDVGSGSPTDAPKAVVPTGSPASTVDEVVAVFRALAAGGDRASLVQTIAASDERAVSEAFRSRRPGGDPAASIGAAKAAEDLGLGRWLSPIRRLAGDPDPGVRAAAASAMGALCTPVVYRNLEALVRDNVPEVQSAALAAIAVAATKLRYESQASRLIQALPDTEVEALTDARKTALDLMNPS